MITKFLKIRQNIADGKVTSDARNLRFKMFNINLCMIWKVDLFDLSHHKAPHTFVCIIYLHMVWCCSNGISTGLGLEAGFSLGWGRGWEGKVTAVMHSSRLEDQSESIIRFCWEWVVCFRRNEIWNYLQPRRPWLSGWIFGQDTLNTSMFSWLSVEGLAHTKSFLRHQRYILIGYECQFCFRTCIIEKYVPIVTKRWMLFLGRASFTKDYHHT